MPTIILETLLPIFQLIDEMVTKEKTLSLSNAHDVKQCLHVMIGKPLNEQTVVDARNCLRSLKNEKTEFAINRIIKILIRVTG